MVENLTISIERFDLNLVLVPALGKVCAFYLNTIGGVPVEESRQVFAQAVKWSGRAVEWMRQLLNHLEDVLKVKNAAYRKQLVMWKRYTLSLATNYVGNWVR